MSPVPVAAVAAVVGAKGALKILDHVLHERRAAREAETARAQLGHERSARELEQRLERTVRAMPAAARREFEQARAKTMEHEHTR